MLKMYVVVREDIPVNHQAVQASHALANFAAEHPQEFAEWQGGNNTITVLGTPNGASLARLVEQARDIGLVHTEFIEPDPLPVQIVNPLNKQPLTRKQEYLTTAVAFAPNWWVQYGMLKDLPLAFREPVPEEKPPKGKLLWR